MDSERRSIYILGDTPKIIEGVWREYFEEIIKEKGLEYIFLKAKETDYYARAESYLKREDGWTCVPYRNN